MYDCLDKVKAYDIDTYLHCQRVAQISIYAGKCIGLTNDDLNTLRHTALLHDIGKIKIPKKVLLKKDKLNDNDWDTIKKHPEVGYKIAKRQHIDKDITEGIISHHERWNGNGYPYGLKGEKIPLYGRIIGIADALDAMVSCRPYRYFPLSVDEALTELNVHAGIQFDPYIAKYLLSQDREALYGALLGFRSRCLG